MNKIEICAHVANQLGLNKTETKAVVETFLQTVSEAIARGETVTLSNFGSFRPTKIAPRKGKSPLDGREIEIGESVRIGFRPGTALKKEINGN